jgi:hypothetical protein
MRLEFTKKGMLERYEAAGDGTVYVLSELLNGRWELEVGHTDGERHLGVCDTKREAEKLARGYEKEFGGLQFKPRGSGCVRASDSHYDYLVTATGTPGNIDCSLRIERRATDDRPWTLIVDQNFDDGKMAKAVAKRFHEYGDRVYKMDFGGWRQRFEDAKRDVLAVKPGKKMKFTSTGLQADAVGKELRYWVIPVFNHSEDPDDWRWRLNVYRGEATVGIFSRDYRTRAQAKMIARQIEMFGLDQVEKAQSLVLTHPKISLQLAKINARETLKRHATQVEETVEAWRNAVLVAIDAWDGTGHPPNTRGGILQQQILGETGKVNRERMNRSGNDG